MPHNNTQQASQEVTYMKPEDVDYESPFKFKLTGALDIGDTFLYNPTDSYISISSMLTGEKFDSYGKITVQSYVNVGNWLVLKQPESTQEEDMFGESFRFVCHPYPTIYTYTKDQYSWDGGSCYCSEQFARDAVASGGWTILPSQQTLTMANGSTVEFVGEKAAWQSSEDRSCEAAFTLAEQMVSKALAPAGKGFAEEYMTLSVSRVGNLMKAHMRIPANSSKEVVEATQKLLDSINAPVPSPLIDTIKEACKATNGRLSVHTTQDGFEVYHPWFVDNVKVVDEAVLERLLRVIVLVEGEA